MKKYKDTDGNVIVNPEGSSIPKSKDNSDYQQFLNEMDNGDAELLPFVAPVIPVDQQRHTEYTNRGITIDKMIVALWEEVVEGRPRTETGIDTLQAIRQQVKTDIPNT